MILWTKKNWLYVLLGVPFVALVALFIVAGNAENGGAIAIFLGMDKKETMQFIAYLMGGVLTVFGLVALNRRADAQVRNNELIEKGHINERFKSATESLGHKEAGVRIAAYYQFYYLAKESDAKVRSIADFRENIFEILCAHLRDMTRRESYRTGEGAQQPTEECQTLLNVLFKKGKDVFAGFEANLIGAYLVNANLQDAHMEGANFTGANLRTVVFSRAKLGRPILCHAADLTDANFSGVDIDITHPTSCPRMGKWAFYADGELARYSKDEKRIPPPPEGIIRGEVGWRSVRF